MEIKTGIDLIKDSRIKTLSEQSLKKTFHPSELKTKKLASIFALKEATFKALEIFPQWLEVEVSYKNSKPKIILSDKIKPKNLVSMGCSVSHEEDFTVGQVVMLLD